MVTLGLLNLKQLDDAAIMIKGGIMPTRSLEKRFGTIAIQKGFSTEVQLNSALDAQVEDTLQQRRHTVLGTILFGQGHINVEQIDKVLGVMKESLS